jgi:Domain of unknown function (DUF4402)
MTGLKQLALALAVVLATAPPAGAQCRLCDAPSTGRAEPGPASGDVELRIESTLNFDRLILTGGGSGAVTMRPDGSSGAEGSVMQLSPRAMVGTVQVHGEANRAVRVQLPHRIELHSLGGGQITLDDVTSDLPSSPHLDPAGNLSFRLGGRLVVTGDTDGAYRGDLPITVEYS